MAHNIMAEEFCDLLRLFCLVFSVLTFQNYPHGPTYPPWIAVFFKSFASTYRTSVRQNLTNIKDIHS